MIIKNKGIKEIYVNLFLWVKVGFNRGLNYRSFLRIYLFYLCFYCDIYEMMFTNVYIWNNKDLLFVEGR